MGTTDVLKAPTLKSDLQHTESDTFEEDEWSIPLDHLHFMSVLGTGGFAVVEKAQWHPPGRPTLLVAVKKLKADVLRDPRELKSFAKEMGLLKTISHKNIAKFYGGGGTHDVDSIEHDPPYMVQELVAGGSLKQMLYKQCMANPRRMYSDRTAVNWMLGVAEALGHLHGLRHKIIHRDLKPDNVLLEGAVVPETIAKIVDFGLATVAARRQSFKAEVLMHHGHTEFTSNRSLGRQLNRQLSIKSIEDDSDAGARSLKRTATFALSRTNTLNMSRASSAASRTSTLGRSLSRTFSFGQKHGVMPGSILHEKFFLSKATGSYFYMAPEVFRGDPYNEKVDVFSFGMILYELLHRRIIMSTVIIKGTIEEVTAYAERVSKGERPNLHEKLHPRLAEIISRCWDGDSDCRPPMSEVADVLRSLLASGELSTLGDEQPGCGAGSCAVC